MLKLSVIVPVFNGEKTLPGLLDSLFSNREKSDRSDMKREKTNSPKSASWRTEDTTGFARGSSFSQDFPQNCYEVILVDDGSTDRTEKIAKGYPAVYFKQKNQGAGAARNAGVAKARGEILLFVDSDCLVSSGWLKAHYQAHQRSPKSIIIGGGVRPPRENHYLSWSDYLSSWYNVHQDLTKQPVEYLPSLNLSLRKQDFKKIGGFWQKKLTGEDVIFCRESRRKGIKIIFDPKLALWHQSPTLGGFFKHQYHWGRHAPKVRGEYPDLAYHWLFSGSFLKSLCLFLPILFGFTFFLAYNWLPYRPGKFLWCLPLIFAGKIVYCLGFLKGSWEKSVQNHKLD